MQVTKEIQYAKVATPLKTVFQLIPERAHAAVNDWIEVAEVSIFGPAAEEIKIVVQRRGDNKFYMVADSFGFQYLVEFRGDSAATPEELWANFVQSGFVKSALTWRRNDFVKNSQ